jgi:hypothetical protein
MPEEVMYPVCPHRNVPAAFERFFGPDSGGVERFFPNASSHRTDATVFIVTQHGKRAIRGAVQILEATPHRVSQAIVEFNAGLWAAWTASACAIYLLATRAYRAGRSASVLSGSRSMAARLGLLRRDLLYRA